MQSPQGSSVLKPSNSEIQYYIINKQYTPLQVILVTVCRKGKPTRSIETSQYCQSSPQPYYSCQHIAFSNPIEESHVCQNQMNRVTQFDQIDRRDKGNGIHVLDQWNRLMKYLFWLGAFTCKVWTGVWPSKRSQPLKVCCCVSYLSLFPLHLSCFVGCSFFDPFRISWCWRIQGVGGGSRVFSQSLLLALVKYNTSTTLLCEWSLLQQSQ